MNYSNLKKCPGCNGPIFKYVNVSNDTFHAQCGYTSFITSDVNVNGVLQKNIDVPAKKLPCDFKMVFDNNLISNEPSEIYDDYNTIYDTNIIKSYRNMESKNEEYEYESEDEECEDFEMDIENEEDELEEEEVEVEDIEEEEDTFDVEG
tara:strand:+ start:273 stop:719 length:447 start_codon:yes stop_codon:yes gene_type:complete